MKKNTLFVLIPPPLPEREHLCATLAPYTPAAVASSTKAEGGDGNCNNGDDVRLLTTRIPLQPPLSAAQAEKWTKELWPVTFNPAAPRGMVAPPPQLLRHVMQSIAGSSSGPGPGYYISLARKVAREAEESGRGRGVGCVVVDATGSSSKPVIVAVAGDARYAYPCPVQQDTEEESSPQRPNIREQEKRGPESHATMRAIEMVASQLRAASSSEHEQSSAGKPPTLTPPLTPLESEYYNTSHRSAGDADAASVPGYLCTNLDLYLTHEPCLSCSMGILLSRFRAVVFARKGRLSSGGLASEEVPNNSSSREKQDSAPDAHAQTPQEAGDEEKMSNQRQRNYYGLHWRKELNWRALCFEFVEDDETGNIDDNDHDSGGQNDDDVFNA